MTFEEAKAQIEAAGYRILAYTPLENGVRLEAALNIRKAPRLIKAVGSDIDTAAANLLGKVQGVR